MGLQFSEGAEADFQKIVSRYPNTLGALLPVLHLAQSEFGWVSVEVPGGFSLWVFGKYLKPIGEGDIHEVTRNAVNIRPRPASDVTNFPMPQRLHAGDRVRVITQLEADKPLAETWANIWSPPGVRGWMRTSATEPVVPSGRGSSAWWIRRFRTQNCPDCVTPAANWKRWTKAVVLTTGLPGSPEPASWTACQVTHGPVSMRIRMACEHMKRLRDRRYGSRRTVKSTWWSVPLAQEGRSAALAGSSRR